MLLRLVVSIGGGCGSLGVFVAVVATFTIMAVIGLGAFVVRVGGGSGC